MHTAETLARSLRTRASLGLTTGGSCFGVSDSSRLRDSSFEEAQDLANEKSRFFRKVRIDEKTGEPIEIPTDQGDTHG